MKQPILIIGKNGQVSLYLQQALKSYSCVVLASDDLDLAQTEAIQVKLQQINPCLVINPAAYTAVDMAETEQECARLINTDAVAEVARWCADQAVPLIHYSTDYVFSGQGSRAYKESDQVAPTGVYGLTKQQGEQAVLDSGAQALILRTAWVYSNQGKNFYRTMLNLAKTRSELSVVADQVGSPTYAGSIAQATLALVQRILSNQMMEDDWGVYHFTCQGQASWCEFAQAIFSAHKLAVKVNAISTADYPTPAKRPAFSVLDNHKLMQHFGIELPIWQDALMQCVQETNA